MEMSTLVNGYKVNAMARAYKNTKMVVFSMASGFSVLVTVLAHTKTQMGSSIKESGATK